MKANTRQWPMYAGNPNGKLWLNVDSQEWTVKEYGGDPIAVTVIEDADGDYYGWIETDSDDGTPVMIQPHVALFSMQFPYGPQSEVERGRGEIVRLRVEASV